MAVNPLAKGEHIMQESLWVDNETSYFDGFQAFFLQKNMIFLEIYLFFFQNEYFISDYL